MSFEEIGLLVNDLLECFVKKENEQKDKSSILCKQIKKKLETDFKLELSPELKIQRGEENLEPEINDPIESSTPLKIEQLEEIQNQEKENLLKSSLIINKTDIGKAVAMAENSNEAVIDEIINPAPGLIVDNTVHVDSQLDFENNDLDTTFRLSNTLQEKLDNILEQARKKVSSL